MKIYLAGPDVFRPDVLSWAELARETCRRYGYEALIPIDHGETEAPRIFQANLDLIRKAQIVVANLNPFRGVEPDSGTCFELGYALALDKKVFGYVERMETLQARVNRIEGGDPARTHDNLGMAIENFGLPLNLMLAVPAMIVEGGLEDCLKQLRGGTRETATPAANLPENPLARKAVEAAIRYLRWVADGKIDDGKAIATVADQYKVREETVQGWINGWSGISLASHADYRPDDVVRQMKISGRQFRSAK
ncbi:MAG: nucleoside 2-deoxyribosyltransferase [Rhodocyclaceae bacterium]|nr:nucleoside 2-deoxyribosyltransferase [Rhodocyclaceae bacterium]